MFKNKALTAACLMVVAHGFPAFAQEPVRALRLSAAENLPYWEVRAERVVREAYRRLNIAVEVTQLPTNRALQESNAGMYDGDLARVSSIEADFPSLLRVPTKIADYVIVPVVLKVPTANVSTYAALRDSGLRIGTPLGMRASVDQLRGAKLETPTNLGSLLEMLAAGRIDVAVMPKGLLKSSLASLTPTAQKNLHTAVELMPVASQPLYHYLHRKNGDLITPLDGELKKMTEDGSIKRIWAEPN